MKTTVMAQRRGRGRPRKNSNIQNAPNLKSFLSFSCPRKPRTKTIFRKSPKSSISTTSAQHLEISEKNFNFNAQRDYESFYSTPSPSSNSSTTSSEPVAVQFYIPGPIPDLEALLSDTTLLVDFFNNIPEVED